VGRNHSTCQSAPLPQIGNDSRFRSLQVGVCQESFGESIQCNMSWAGHAGGVKMGTHSMLTGTVGDLYLTLAEEVMGAQIGKFPSASRKLTDIV